MSFQISPELDASKFFLVRSSELEGRLDPVMVLYQRKTNSFKYKTKRLVELLKKKPQYGANESGIDRLSKDVPRYIRITDINEYGELNNELGKTASRIENKYFLYNNEILFARSGATVGKSYIHKSDSVSYKCFFAGYMIRFIIDTEKVNPDYIFSYTQTKTYRDWVLAIQRASGQPNINAEEYNSLKIPIPPPEIQSAIVAKMDAAYASKRAKEAEAQRLLDSIDDYLLRELGIELPEQEENTVQSRIFTRRFSEISGGRLDPNTYKKERVEVIKRIRKGRYASKPVYLILEHKNNRTSQIDEKTLYIGLENIKSNTGEWVASDVKESVSSAAVFSKNDILFPKLRPYLNKVYFAEMNGICSTEFHVFRAYHDDNQYISTFLRSKAVVCQTKCLMSGNTLPRLQFEDIQKLLIPLPPLEKQTEIADHIAQIRRRAKQLQQEAVEGLEQAKLEVEALLLGDAQK